MKDIIFTLTQLCEKHAKALDGYQLSYARIVVGRVRDASEPAAATYPIEFIGGNHSQYDNDISVAIPGEYPPGTYIAYLQVDWANEALLHKFVFRTYCEHPTVLTKINDGTFPKFLSHAMRDCAHRFARLQSMSAKGQPNIFVAADMNSSQAGIGILYYENNSTDKMLKVQTQLTKNVGIVVDTPELLTGHIIKVKPGKAFAYAFPHTLRNGASFGYGYIPQFLAPDADSEEPFGYVEEKKAENKEEKDMAKNEDIIANGIKYNLKDF